MTATDQKPEVSRHSLEMSAKALLPRTLGEEMDMTPRERELTELLASALHLLKEDDLQNELRDEQLSWARDTLSELRELHDQIQHTRVGEIRQRVREIVSDCRVDY